MKILVLSIAGTLCCLTGLILVRYDKSPDIFFVTSLVLHVLAIAEAITDNRK